jgi:hypothetical protein
MKKVLSTIVAALVAVSFAGIVCAAEPANSEVKTESTTTNAAGEKVEKKVTKKKKTSKKGKKVKKTMKKEETTTAPEPAPAK